MNENEAQARIEEIQRIMERATLWTILPGISAVIGGGMVLVGCAVSLLLFHSISKPAFSQIDFASLLDLSLNGQIFFCVLWFLIGACGFILEIHFAQLQAEKEGISSKGRSARLVFFSFTPSVVVAMVLTLKFLSAMELRAQEIQYIAPVWMMLYGTGVYTAGLFSVRAPRILGMAFIGAGVISLLLLQQYGIITTAAVFGCFHIAFGLYVMRKQKVRVST